MPAGRRQHYITIQQATETPSAASNAIMQTWSAFTYRWAEIVTSGGREFSAAQAIHGELTHLVKCAGYAAITNKMRVLMADGRVLEILAAYAPDGRACENAPEVHLACRESL